ncbi:MAG: sulfatase-like hydrolase/transferase [Planctomycetales bacterium]
MILRIHRLWLVLFLLCSVTFAAERKPNVILIMTDDQGFGDLGFTGNKQIQTPHLDAFANSAVYLDQFHVSPVCTPTRASLMTGRYNYRTRAIDTYLGRAMMDPAEVTLAEMLRGHGYHTGIFGKWHLGDNYPLRSMDQGFEESLVHPGGGLMQPANPPQNHYTDPILWHNGQPEKQKGYCSDIYTTAAIEFIEHQKQNPFFVYLAFNAPHSPLEVPDEELLPYSKLGLSDNLAHTYAMVTNIDRNLGRLFAKLDSLQLADDTLVIFLMDNGPAFARYNAGMRSERNTLRRGTRVPCFIRLGKKLPAGKRISVPTAAISISPPQFSPHAASCSDRT